MPNARHFNYKGCSIITLCVEVTQAVGRPGQFSACFSVKPLVDGAASWHKFPSGTFGDKAAATANALTAAKKSIDSSLAAG